jgi:hypothetical protein
MVAQRPKIRDDPPIFNGVVENNEVEKSVSISQIRLFRVPK